MGKSIRSEWTIFLVDARSSRPSILVFVEIKNHIDQCIRDSKRIIKHKIIESEFVMRSTNQALAKDRAGNILRTPYMAVTSTDFPTDTNGINVWFISNI